MCSPCGRRFAGAKLLPPSYAIKGSPNQKLLLEDIYYAIESRVCGTVRLMNAVLMWFLCSSRISKQPLQAGK
jgi:hypothetical protein